MKMAKRAETESETKEQLWSQLDKGFACMLRVEGSDQHPQPMSRSEEHTSELQSLRRISYAVFCLKKKNYTLCEGVRDIEQILLVYINSSDREKEPKLIPLLPFVLLYALCFFFNDTATTEIDTY